MELTSRKGIEDLLAQARGLVPKVTPVILSPMPDYPDVPQWHKFEHSLWAIGEKIRHVINSQTKFRGDRSLYAEIFHIVQDRNAMRGRQSFVLLFAYRPCVAWAQELASLIPDADIDGHVISALYKMKASGFSSYVAPFLSSRTTWIRKEAERYTSFDKFIPSNFSAEM